MYWEYEGSECCQFKTLSHSGTLAGRGEVAVLVGLIGTGAHHLSCNDTLVLVTLVEQTVHELRKTVNDQFRL